MRTIIFLRRKAGKNMSNIKSGMLIVKTLVVLFIVTGCRAMLPPIVINDPEKWHETRAIEVINKAKL